MKRLRVLVNGCVLTARLVAVTFVLTCMRLEREKILPPRRLCMVVKLIVIFVD